MLKFIYNSRINTQSFLWSFTDIVPSQGQKRPRVCFLFPTLRDYQKMKTVGGSAEWFKKLQFRGWLDGVGISAVGGLVVADSDKLLNTF